MAKTPQQDLSDLLSATAMADRRAFETLYSRTSAKLFGICLRILKEPALAQEALQEVYVKIWHKADTFMIERARPITWMCRIARNHAIDRLRQQKPAAQPIDDAYEIADKGPTPEQALLQSDDARNLDRCINKLKSNHAFAVRHAYIDGWTYDEIATKLERPTNTVKTWVRRALGQLKECLQR